MDLFNKAQRLQRTASRKDYYKVLGTTKSASKKEIKKAFRKASMNTHPDRVSQHGKTVEVAEEEFKCASAAFAMLEDIYRSKGRMN